MASGGESERAPHWGWPPNGALRLIGKIETYRAVSQGVGYRGRLLPNSLRLARETVKRAADLAPAGASISCADGLPAPARELGASTQKPPEFGHIRGPATMIGDYSTMTVRGLPISPT